MLELSSTGIMSKLQVADFKQIMLFIFVFNSGTLNVCSFSGSFSAISFMIMSFNVFVVADIPGIIRGAHLNRGLGISFLRHIERCRFLLFVLDLSNPNPWTQLQDLHYELDQYEPGLSQRPQAIIANKIDLPEAQDKLESLKSRVTQRVIPVSALTGQNTEELILHLRELYDGYLQGEGKAIRW